jgi:hypothetical protein
MDALILLRLWVSQQLAALRDARRDLVASGAVLVGWALITLALSRVARSDVVWPLSAGVVLLFAAGGVKQLGLLFWHGLHWLTSEESNG